METPIDCLSKPDVLLVFALARPPVLLGNAARLGVNTALSCLHIAENLYGIQSATLVGVNPIVACKIKKEAVGTVFFLFLSLITPLFCAAGS